MKRLLYVLSSLLALAVAVHAAEPAPFPRSAAGTKVAPLSGFEPPAVLIPIGGFAIYVPEPEVKAAEYIGLDGEEAFPVAMIGGSPTAFVFFTRGLPEKNYRFVGIASDAGGKLTRKQFVVQVGVTIPPPIKPPAPPVDPPDTTPTALYFLIVRADGPAAPEFTRTMGDPAWGTLQGLGHSVKPKTVTQAAAINVTLPAGTVLPVVITIREGATDSVIVRDAIPLPTTSAGILKLPEGVSK